MATNPKPPMPDPNEKLVRVFDSENESEALIVKGLLESSGIESDLQSASLLQDNFPGLGGMVIQVREEDAATAKQLIEDRQRAALGEDETAEYPAIADPEPKA